MLQNQKLDHLRKIMANHNVSGFVLPSSDEFMGEYVPAYGRRLEYLTGFTGSAGLAIILKDKAAFFTDGRYTLQASKELPKNYEILNTADIKPTDWLKANFKKGDILAIDPNLHTKDNISKYQNVAQVKYSDNLIDVMWPDRPKKPLSQIFIYETKYAGRTYTDKLQDIYSFIKQKEADFLMVTAPESICWLLNIRGKDVPNTPFVLSRLLLDNKKHGILFVDMAENKEISQYLGSRISIKRLSELPDYLKQIKNKKILLDKNTAPYFFYELLSKNNGLVDIVDPCILPKACKNKVEIKVAKNVHVKDGKAVASFIKWLKVNYKKQVITEISAAEKLLEFRRKNKGFIGPSFDTIAGFAANGAIVHYRANKESNKRIAGNNLLLLDSGGQYLGGTTDITRTIAIGKPTKEQIRNFTLVLKGHIALARAVFPEGTTGNQLDILARQYLWQNGLDYDHGTGHGVGSFLSVHEGPQRISKAYNDVPLMEGMILSNEPGYYKPGEYGIRIENLVLVEKYKGHKVSGTKKFLSFRTLTIAPLDKSLIDFFMLSDEEKKWVLEYQKK